MRKARLLVAAGLGALGATLTRPASAPAEQKPYRVEDGRVDQGAYNGYRRYGNSCLHCHGPDGLGSIYGSNLVEGLKRLTREQFGEVVARGRHNVSAAQQSVMPPFAQNRDVMQHLDDIYAYLKARSDGALGRGRPQRLEK